MITTILAIVAIQGVFVGAVARYHGKSRSHSVSDLAIEPKAIDFGEVELGAHKNPSVNLQNVGTSELQLDWPRVSCGCLKPFLSRRDLEPGQDAVLSFEFVAPTTPQEVNRTIELSDESGTVWTIPVHAKVVADVWFSPAQSRINLVDGRGSANVYVFRSASQPDVTAEPSTRSLKVELVTTGDRNKCFRISIASKEAGDGIVEILDHRTRKKVASLPVHWEPKRVLTLEPTTISVSPDSGTVRRTVLITCDRNKVKEAIKVVSLGRGVRVLETRILNPNVTLVTLEIDSSILRVQNHKTVVDVGIPGTDYKDGVTIERVAF